MCMSAGNKGYCEKSLSFGGWVSYASPKEAGRFESFLSEMGILVISQRNEKGVRVDPVLVS